tara:strand:- start:562 stop:858 length:297 start_codon:yes stop_codon:yes gene_type:complete
LPLVVIDTGFFSQIAIQYVGINPYDDFGIGPPIGVFIHSINADEAINKNIVLARIGLTYGFIQLDECPVDQLAFIDRILRNFGDIIYFNFLKERLIFR